VLQTLSYDFSIKMMFAFFSQQVSKVITSPHSRGNIIRSFSGTAKF
jgi:hypothetical protein